jgi:hypothetical protein
MTDSYIYDEMDTTVVHPNNKITLVVKRCQDKKTQQAIHLIRDRIMDETPRGSKIETRYSIHFIFTMNTLLNNKQFSLRLRQIEALCGGRDKIVEFSSKQSGSYNHVSNIRELKGLMLDPKTRPRIVICCSNTMRFSDGESIMSDVDRVCGTDVRQYAYYDELHKYIGMCRSQLVALHALDSVKGIVGLTATPEPIFVMGDPFWSSIRLMPVDDLSGNTYCALSDHTYVHAATDLTAKAGEMRTVEYVRSVLAAHPTILKPDSYTFIPGTNLRRSHLAVRDAVWAANPKAVVVVLNMSKTIQYKDINGDPCVRQIVGESEIGADIAAMIKKIAKENVDEGFKSRPLVVTGFICVGMGQSLVCPELGTFTSAIVSHEDLSNEDIYQLLGRTASASRDWRSFRPTKVYCPEETYYRATTMESVAMAMAEFGDEHVTLQDLREPMNDDEAGRVTLSHVRPPKKERVKKSGRTGPLPPGSKPPVDESKFRLFRKMTELKAALADYYPEYKFRNRSYNKEKPDFYEAACNGPAAIVALHDAVHKVHTLTGGKGDTATGTVWMPMYSDTNDAETLVFMMVMPKDMTAERVAVLAAKHPSVRYTPA